MIHHKANQLGSHDAMQRLGISSVPPARWSSAFNGPVQTGSTRTAAMTKVASSPLLRARLEKRANWRNLGLGLPHDTSGLSSIARGQSMVADSRPGDLVFRLDDDQRRTANILQRLESLGEHGRTDPRRVAQAIARGGVGEGVFHAAMVTNPQTGEARGFPMGVEDISDGFTVVGRPKGVTPAQGEAAAFMMENYDGGANTPFQYKYPVGMKDENRNPLLLNRAGQALDERAGTNFFAPRFRAFALRAGGGTRGVCDPTSEVCSTTVGRAYESPAAFGENARARLIGAPELTPGQAKMFSSPSALLRSPNIEFVGANFDVAEALRRQAPTPTAREIYNVLPLRDLARNSMSSPEIMDMVSRRLGPRGTGMFVRMRNRLFRR